MPRYTIGTPSGRTLTIEADDEATAIRGAQEWETQNPPDMPKPPPGAIIHGADRSYIADKPEIGVDRQSGMVGDAAGEQANAVMMEALRRRGEADMTRGLLPALQGASMGFGDEAASAAAAATSGRDFGTEYAVNMERMRQDLARERTDNPIRSTLTEIAGAVPLAAVAPVAGGRSLGGKVLGGAASGAGYGALYGAGSGSGADGRTAEAAKGAVVGGVLGGVAPLVGAGASKAWEGVKSRLDGLPGDLSGFSRGAVDRVSRAAQADDLTQAGAAKYGPEGMLADAGDNLRDQAGAIANMPGKGQTTLRTALDARKAGATDRIMSDTDAALGKTFNVPETLKAIKDRADKAAKPLYDQFRQTPVPFTQQLDDVVAQLKNEPSVLVQARRLVNLDDASGPKQFFAQIADDGTVTINRVPNAAEWDYVKRALDGMANAGKRSGDDNAVRIYSSLAAKVRDSVDEAISPGNPGASVWAKARAIKADDFQVRDAFEAGTQAFKKGLRPDQMAFDMKGYTPAEKLAYQMGARSHVQNVMGNAATKFGSNADTAAMRELGSDFAREKLATITSPDKARQLAGRLDTEAAFETTRQGVTQNSATARRLAAQKEFPTTGGDNAVARELGQRSLTGVALEGLYRAANLFTGGMVKANREKVSADAARMLASMGPERDKIVTALIAYGQNKALTKAQADMVEKFTGALVNASRGPATNALPSYGQ